MSLIRPSFVENLYHTFFQLEADRPMYYLLVVRLARSIFMSLGYDDLVIEMDALIKEIIEIPLHADFVSIIHAFYNPRFMFSKQAYTKIGDSIDYQEVTRYEIMMRLEYVKDWIYDKIVELSPYIRFTRTQQMLT